MSAVIPNLKSRHMSVHKLIGDRPDAGGKQVKAAKQGTP